MPRVFCGIDWASDHHDVALIDQDGALLAKLRIDDNPAGLARLLNLLAEHGDTHDTLIPVAIETSHGLLVACLRSTGRPVYAINPLAAARYRDRYALTRKKSDHLDAKVLANILRTDIAEHRQLPADSELAQAITVLARAQQDAVWDRVQAGNRLRSHLREYFPGFLPVFAHFREGIASPVVRTLLAAAPTPTEAAQLSRTQLRGLLKKAGRQREIGPEVERLHHLLREPQMQQPPLVEQAMGAKARALLRQFDAACASADELEAATISSFEAHPDAEIITSFPGLGSLTGARVLAELGDDRSRFADARAVKAYAGAAPITRASGKKTTVLARHVKNQRLAAVGYLWAFAALTASPGARAHYDRRRAGEEHHTAAQRNLFNRMLGCLHHCLTKHILYDETTAFPTPPQRSAAIAA
ncbi:IS110 family transposase [Streptomyces sp. NBS 14/10]|uniref:IS110 family transposase n=1 Tax=Streptomyces sp. NBS 14/10 TaxID=1945643 RepID=UPI000B7DE68B|nr:IS110 family transposase [Streptomyces sp. NBS 14/10]KAK1182140.1 IS110 family transposase [Streptomyces sp. NBS 14/10]